MILHKLIKNPEDATRKLLDFINELDKVKGYKINTQSLEFLYNNNERSERNIKETIPFTILSKRLKYLRINLPKEAKMCTLKNYKTLMKETEDYTNRWKDIPCSWIGGITVVQMTIILKAIYIFNAMSIKLPRVFFTELEQIFLKNLYENTKTLITKAILRKKNGARGIRLLTLDYTIKLQSSKQYDTSTKTKM